MFEEIVIENGFEERLEVGKIRRHLLQHRQLDVYSHILRSPRISDHNKALVRRPKYRAALLKHIQQDIKDRLKPQETYEIWNQQHSSNLYRMSSKDHKLDEVYDDRLIKQIADSIEEDSDDDDEDIYRKSLKTLAVRSSPSATRSSIEYLILTEGLEILPSLNVTVKVLRYHLRNLKFFLHRSILTKNWDLAYKIFCMLIRVPNIDIRSIWPLGIEILRGQAKTNPGASTIFTSKEDRFFTWLSSFFVVAQPSLLPRGASTFAPSFRTGSKNHVPMYVVTSLWGLMDRGQYKKVREDLAPLLYERPYNEDGVFPYIIALSLMAENIKLAEQFTRVDRHDHHEDDDPSVTTKADIFAKISDNFKQMDQNLDQCKKLNFLYPEDLIQEQTETVLSNITEEDDDMEDDQSDSHDSEDLGDTRIIDNDLETSTLDNGDTRIIDTNKRSPEPEPEEEPYWSDEESDDLPDRQLPSSPANEMDFDFDF